MSLCLYFGLYHFAWLLVRHTFVAGLVGVAAVWLLLKIPLVKEAVDRLLLQLPVVRETEIRLAVVLFFGTFRLVYEAGGLGVLPMFDLALSTVRNSAVRRDLLQARRILERQGTFGDAFEEPLLLETRIKGLIATGSLSGQLESSLGKVVGVATQELEFRLSLLNQFLYRLVAFEVAIAIAETFVMCLAHFPGR
jgi:type II secretory pathway component PulF